AWLERNGIAATLTIPLHPRDGTGIRLIGYRSIFPASMVEAIRGRIRQFIDANCAYPESAELKALVIGDRSGIDDNLRDEFARTGMAHLLVISGLHLGLVAAAGFALARFILGFFTLLLERGYANKIAALFAACAVISYAAIAGHHVSTTRALVMVLTYMFAIVIDRGREVLASLAFAAIIICVLFPGSSADIGFELTFASVLAIVLGMRRFIRWWRRRIQPVARNAAGIPWPYAAAVIVAGYFAVSFWALLGTAPLTARYFNQFSIVGLVANAMVVPIAGFGGAVIGLAAAAMSFLSLTAAVFLLHVSAFFLRISTWLTAWFCLWPLSWVRTFTPTSFEIALAYALLLLWLTLPLKSAHGASPISGDLSRKAWRWRRAAFAMLIILTFADGGWWTYQRYFNPDLRVTFLSVGEGDAAVVRFPGSRVMLIDSGGAYGSAFDPGQRIVAPFLWSRKILHVNYIALSHPDLDHFGGFEFIARNFGPSQFWTSVNASPDQRYLALLVTLIERHIRLRLMDSRSPPLRIHGVTIRCVGPAPGEYGTRNDASMVLKIADGPASFLFTGDIESAGERAIISSGADLRATILKVPHHGSRSSSTAGFIEAVGPRLAVISLGYLNRYHFPASSVIARYRRFGAGILRTDRDGAISVNVSADAVRVRTWRHGNFRLPAGQRSGR
ncbi:MAG: DNA internalization-related competence protein ComEC/Rec2, partial [Candidatus Binataceae bacterium]